MTITPQLVAEGWEAVLVRVGVYVANKMVYVSFLWAGDGGCRDGSREHKRGLACSRALEQGLEVRGSQKEKDRGEKALAVGHRANSSPPPLRGQAGHAAVKQTIGFLVPLPDTNTANLLLQIVSTCLLTPLPAIVTPLICLFTLSTTRAAP